MLSEDPTASSPIKPPKVTSRNPALCDQCNECLVLDDSVIEPYVKTVGGRFLCIGRSSPNPHGIFAMFGGIEYTRKDGLPDLPALSHAAENGCEFCAAVKEGLKTKYQGAPWWRAGSGPLILRMQYAWQSSGDFVDRTGLHSIVVIVSQDETQGWEKTALQFLVWQTKGEDACNQWLAMPLWESGDRWIEDDEPWSLNNISKAKGWIQNCVKQSGCCRWKTPSQDASNDIGASADFDDSGSRFLPTRLLDLSPDMAHQSSNKTPDEVKLFETASLQGQNEGVSTKYEALRYAALSYCWGGVDPVAKTTNANFNHGYRNIEVSSLPQCLQDAVSVTRKLGIRYLWIDALCIIQEDTVDWAREAGRMLDIFRNAFLTIGAASSTSFDDGFLKCRPRPISIPFSSSCNSQVRGRITVSTIPAFPSWPGYFASGSPLKRDLAVSKWNTRGWVWQEQMLSERLLIFGNEMTHFKCTHGVKSGNNVYCDLQTPRDTIRQKWSRWVQEYSKLELTHIQDKLPAISGLAKMMDQKSLSAGEPPAEYLAGIWRSSQEKENCKGWRGQLCWRLSGKAPTFKEMLEGLKSSTAEKYSAPSWSWASRRQGAQWESTEFLLEMYHASKESPHNFQAQFEEYHRVLMGSDPMGRVMLGSYLKLSGPMRRTPLPLSTAKQSGGRTTLTWFLPSPASLHFCLDWKHSPGGCDEALEYDVRLFGLWRLTFGGRGNLGGRDYFSGLLLLQSKDDGFYYRVGVFTQALVLDKHGRMSDEHEHDFMDWQHTSVSIK